MAALTDYLPISKLNTVAFCPRRYFIEAVLANHDRNHHLTEGATLHERAKRAGEGRWLWSDRLGILGIVDQLDCDRGVWTVGEVKKGFLADHASDQIQLCALAICFEEMTGNTLEQGFIYYHRTRRRQQVPFTPKLRLWVEDAVAQMRALEQQTDYPPITSNTNRCRGCSVREACQPSLARTKAPHWQRLAETR